MVELVVTDLAMPEMMGLEIAARMAERRPTVPILLISGHEGPPAGYPGTFLSKPFTWDVLLVAGLVPIQKHEQ